MLQPIVKCLLTDLAKLLFDFVPELPIGGRALEQASQQAFEIQRRSADEQRLVAAGADFRDGGRRSIDVLRDAVFLVRFDNVQQMMRHYSSLGGRRLSRTDVHASIEGHRVERND